MREIGDVELDFAVEPRYRFVEILRVFREKVSSARNVSGFSSATRSTTCASIWFMPPRFRALIRWRLTVPRLNFSNVSSTAPL